MSMQDESLFREVEEAVRQERMKALWSAYGPYVITGIVLAIAGTGLFYAWSAWQSSQRLEASRSFTAAVDASAEQGETTGIAAFEEVAAQAPAGYAVLADFRRAALLEGRDQRDEALAVYESIGARGDVPAVLRDLAEIKRGWLSADSELPEILIRRMNRLAEPGNSWRPFALELRAYAHLRAGALALAEADYQTVISDPAVTFALRQRAEQMLGHVQGQRPGAAAQSADSPSADEMVSPQGATEGDADPEAQ